MDGHPGRTEHTNGNRGLWLFGFMVGEPSNKPLTDGRSPAAPARSLTARRSADVSSRGTYVDDVLFFQGGSNEAKGEGSSRSAA